MTDNMQDNKDFQERLSNYSVRLAANQTQTTLHDQRMGSIEKLMEGYHQRVHVVEDDIVKIKVFQEIHDTEIKGVKKMLIGNGTRDTIPMDLVRLDNKIQSILNVNWQEMQTNIDALEIQLNVLKEWQQKIDSRAWQLWAAIILLLASNILGLVLR